MKPRERKPQKQKSRLVYRKNDHRDILVYNSTAHKYVYHNALVYSETDKNNLEKDDIVWIKYPNNSIMITTGGDSQVGGGCCAMDVDRQIQYGNLLSNNRGICIAIEELGITVFFHNYGSSCNYYITEDGVIWQHLSLTYYYNANGNGIYHFGNDKICWYERGQVYYDEQSRPYYLNYTLHIWTFNKNEDTGKWSIAHNTYSYTTEYRFNRLEFVCNTNQGVILYEGRYFAEQYQPIGVDNEQYVHIDHAGVRTVKKWTLRNPSPILGCDSIKHTYCKIGSYCYYICFCYNYTLMYGRDYYTWMYVGRTMDNGATWEGELLEEEYWNIDNVPEQNRPTDARLNMLARDGEVFVFYCVKGIQGKKFKMFTTRTGSQWDEVSLPTMIEVPVIQSGGAGVVINPGKDTYKIALDPQNASGQDINMFEFMSSDTFNGPEYNGNLRSGSILYQGGELQKVTDKEMYFVFGMSQPGKYSIFIDSRNFEITDRAFAWKVTPISYNQSADYVIEGDYCAPANVGDLVEDTTEIIGYDYYIWENGAYRKVYTTTPYTHHQLVVVSELPAQGAVNVLYKVAYYQSMTDWTDNVDYGG